MGQRENCNENYKIFRFTNVKELLQNFQDAVKAVLRNIQT